uniref:Uncharacterized protein n=1 Tax=Micrurus surinamensis TaxID=129470 RepID=A0A2D4Q3M1_MICSU
MGRKHQELAREGLALLCVCLCAPKVGWSTGPLVVHSKLSFCFWGRKSERHSFKTRKTEREKSERGSHFPDPVELPAKQISSQWSEESLGIQTHLEGHLWLRFLGEGGAANSQANAGEILLGKPQIFLPERLE